MNAASRSFLQDLPTLHVWGGRPQVGGLDRRIGKRIVEELEALDVPAIIETGAGATTLLFLCLNPSSVTSIAPDAELRNRVFAEAASRSIPTEVLRFVTGRSEWVLPELAAAGEPIDVALIDG